MPSNRRAIIGEHVLFSAQYYDDNLFIEIKLSTYCIYTIEGGALRIYVFVFLDNPT